MIEYFKDSYCFFFFGFVLCVVYCFYIKWKKIEMITYGGYYWGDGFCFYGIDVL